MDFKFPTESLPFSMNPNPSSLPVGLAERETRDISTSLPEAQYEKTRRRVTRVMLDYFWWDMGVICSMALAQCCAGHPLHRAHDDGAARNRARIERERLREELRNAA